MIKITENSLRDGHQSLLATRVRTEDLIEAAKIFEDIGFYSVEVWGGATYDTCLRFLKEDPFERLKILKGIFKKTPLQMLLRGQNLVGYRHYADDVVKEFIKLSSDGGIDIFRIFDALNDSKNLKTAIYEVKKQGKIVQGAISYTTSPVHTIKGFVEYAKELVSMGSDSIVIKDMAGLITPFNAYELVSALKDCLDVPIVFHTHSTAGFGFASHLKAVEAGADILDLSNSALASGTSHPCTQSMVATLKGTKWDTKLDIKKMEQAAEVLRRVRKKYKKYESSYSLIDTRVLVNQIPGGMISNMANQLKEQNALSRMDEVMEEIPNVRADFGYPPLVTPSSQIIGTQAVLNVLSGERYKSISKEAKNLARGFYGKTPAKISNEIISKLKEIGEEFIEVRPADLLKDELKIAREESKDFAFSPTDVISYAMFDNVAKEFLIERNSNNLKPESIESFENINEKLNKDFNITVNGEQYNIKIEGSGITNNGIKPFFVRLDGELKEVFVEQSIDTAISNTTSKANISLQSGHIIPSMPGRIIKINYSIGDKVKKGDVVAIIEAMKMENEVISNINGVVKEIYVDINSQISNDKPIMLIQ
ncbi:pyruvate/oxaloacetate carboxyltransferase [Helicobacter sp. MIT 99-5507]|uniref:pyruvate/oxaloacetate carboxyltransferase n=1 Tax=Helicobacter sp. MIT 99-5507 TaxID=152489 RepID=UPI000E1F4F2E|nr:pyruvate/oxaloacetate carboxyltransferase [Helicobacter sp. MIT 99-5507]RDU58238.1 pyruvate carboxylase subunit B [Helicobacter sp. MIT 99-5507]